MILVQQKEEVLDLFVLMTPELRGEQSNLISAKAARGYRTGLDTGSNVSMRRITEKRYGRAIAELYKGPVNI